MIPDHLIDRAAQAILGSTGSTGRLEDLHPDDAAYARADARSALEAVAHIIWNQGWEAGMSFVISLERGIDDDENASNPYERIETA